MDNFERIAIGKRDLAQSRARDDHAIPFDCDLLRIEIKDADKIGDAATGCDPARFAIDG